jgi:phage shock protein C
MKKRLFKDKQTGMFSGVCSGIAQYFNIDVSIIRICYVLLSLLVAGFPGIIIYIVLAIILPDKSSIGFTDYRVDDDGH